jgi:hypothetical protein
VKKMLDDNREALQPIRGTLASHSLPVTGSEYEDFVFAIELADGLAEEGRDQLKQQLLDELLRNASAKTSSDLLAGIKSSAAFAAAFKDFIADIWDRVKSEATPPLPVLELLMPHYAVLTPDRQHAFVIRIRDWLQHDAVQRELLDVIRLGSYKAPERKELVEIILDRQDLVTNTDHGLRAEFIRCAEDVAGESTPAKKLVEDRLATLVESGGDDGQAVVDLVRPPSPPAEEVS